MYTIDNEFFVGLLLRITKNIYAILQVVFSFKCQLQSRAKYINITQTPILKISELLCKLFHDQQTYRIGQKSKKKKMYTSYSGCIKILTQEYRYISNEILNPQSVSFSRFCNVQSLYISKHRGIECCQHEQRNELAIIV